MCDAVLALLLLQANSDTEIDHTLDDVYISGSSGKAIFAVRSVANGRLRSNPSFPQRPIMGGKRSGGFRAAVRRKLTFPAWLMATGSLCKSHDLPAFDPQSTLVARDLSAASHTSVTSAAALGG
jgi:hypothetical protein